MVKNDIREVKSIKKKSVLSPSTSDTLNSVRAVRDLKGGDLFNTNSNMKLEFNELNTNRESRLSNRNESRRSNLSQTQQKNEHKMTIEKKKSLKHIDMFKTDAIKKNNKNLSTDKKIMGTERVLRVKSEVNFGLKSSRLPDIGSIRGSSRDLKLRRESGLTVKPVLTQRENLFK